MKKFSSIIFFALLSIIIHAQAPEEFKMQFLVRNNNSGLLVNQTIGIRISILKGNEKGPAVFSEVINTKTNEFGLVTITAGEANKTQFEKINWSGDYYFSMVELDLSGGEDFIPYGISQLKAVPFCEYAKVSDRVFESDPNFVHWNKSKDIKIQQRQVVDLSHFKTSDENDQIFKSSPSSKINEVYILNWNKILETDPVFKASASAGITNIDTALWNKKSYFSGSYSSLADKPVFAQVSFTGKYSDLLNTPENLVFGTVTGTNKNLIQFDGTRWVSLPVGTPGQQLTVNSLGLAEWQYPKNEEFNSVDRPFFEYNITMDYYDCKPWNYDKPSNSERKYPLVIYLHGSGGAGSVKSLWYLGANSENPDIDQLAKNYQINHTSFVLIPQTKASAWDGKSLIPLIEEYKNKYRIDTKRIYLIGFSMGGAGSYILANDYYDFNKHLFAGIVRLTGETQTIVREEIARKTAIWIQVGLEDLEQRISITRNAYNFLKDFHPNAIESSSNVTIWGNKGTTLTLNDNGKEIVKKTEYINVGHGISVFPYGDGSVMDWLFSQRLE